MSQPTPAQQFAQRLAQERREKSARERRDIQKKDVAKAIGVSDSTYGRYESALTMPDERTMFRLADYFGVTPAWLHYGQEPKTPFHLDYEPTDAETNPPPSVKKVSGGLVLPSPGGGRARESHAATPAPRRRRRS